MKKQRQKTEMKKAVWVILFGVLLAVLAQPIGLGIADLILLIAGDMSLGTYLAIAFVLVVTLLAVGCLSAIGAVISLIVQKVRKA